jgi:hypothetical protein
MRNRSILASLSASAAVLLSLFASHASAHHPILAKFDDARPLTLTGRVTEVDWANPHVHVFISVDDNDGAPAIWAIELASTVELQWSGWRPDALDVGDTITVEGFAARNGSEQIWGNSVERENGEKIFVVAEDVFEKQLVQPAQGALPRWPDNQPRLGPAPGETGYWALPSKTGLIEDGVDAAMDEHGVLANIADASKVAPFQEWAKDLYVLRQSNFLRDDPSFLYCIPPAGPRHLQNPFGFQFVEQRDRARVFMLYAGGNGNWRQIHTDGREQVGQVSGDDNNPLFFGRSVASWEGDTLVVDSKGFNEGFWFSNGGLPHTAQLHVIERFTREDINTLRVEVTVDDPGAYTREWTGSWTMQWIDGKELPEYYCQDNRP